jgi:hypothetical protein
VKNNRGGYGEPQIPAPDQILGYTPYLEINGAGGVIEDPCWFLLATMAPPELQHRGGH